MKSRLWVKLFLSYLLLNIITLVVTAFLLSPLYSRHLINNKKTQLMNQAKEIVTIAENYNIKEMDERSFKSTMETLDRYIDTRFMIVDKDGQIISSSRFPVGADMKAPPPKPWVPPLSKEEFSRVLQGENVIRETTLGSLNLAVITVALPITKAGREGLPEIVGVVITYSPVRVIKEFMLQTYYYLGIASLIAVVLAAAIAYYFSQKITLPLKNMSQAAMAMAGGNYNVRVETTSQDEVGELGLTLNYLAGQLDSNVTALKQEKGKLESIMHSVNEGLIAVDVQSRIILANPVMESILLQPAARMRGGLLSEVHPQPQLITAFREVLQDGMPRSTTIEANTGTFRVVVSPIRQENDTLLGAVGILQDISEMEKVEQLRRDFIANVSHELRAPVTVIRGYIDCLLDKLEDKPPEYYYRIIQNETQRLERLINDTMDLSLLQSGKIKLNLQEVNLTELVQETTELLEQRAETKGVNLQFRRESAQDMTAYCDPDRIEQLLVILLDNALKFTPAGGTITVTLSDREDHLEIGVQDTGAGIPAAELPMIWERFYKGDKSRNRQSEDGTGLGLFIAREIAHLHEASITAESELHKGSTFKLHLKK